MICLGSVKVLGGVVVGSDRDDTDSISVSSISLALSAFDLFSMDVDARPSKAPLDFAWANHCIIKSRLASKAAIVIPTSSKAFRISLQAFRSFGRETIHGLC